MALLFFTVFAPTLTFGQAYFYLVQKKTDIQPDVEYRHEGDNLWQQLELEDVEKHGDEIWNKYRDKARFDLLEHPDWGGKWVEKYSKTHYRWYTALDKQKRVQMFMQLTIRKEPKYSKWTGWLKEGKFDPKLEIYVNMGSQGGMATITDVDEGKDEGYDGRFTDDKEEATRFKSLPRITWRVGEHPTQQIRDTCFVEVYKEKNR